MKNVASFAIPESKTLRVKNALRKNTRLFIYDLFNDSDYTASNGRTVSKMKEAVVKKSEALSRHLYGGVEGRPGNTSVSITGLRAKI
jgi:hypothetical protein